MWQAAQARRRISATSASSTASSTIPCARDRGATACELDGRLLGLGPREPDALERALGVIAAHEDALDLQAQDLQLQQRLGGVPDARDAELVERHGLLTRFLQQVQHHHRVGGHRTLLTTSDVPFLPTSG